MAEEPTQRPIDHITRDLKKADEEIAAACSRRTKLVAELRQLADVATSLAAEADAATPNACNGETP